MNLSPESISWAIDFVADHSDGDLFPKILEIEAIQAEKDTFSQSLVGMELSQLPTGSCRRFIVPKDELSYRQATQLDLQDSIILSSIIYQYGAEIEARREPSNKIFSYRFHPTPQDGLYGNLSAWNDFWRTAIEKSRQASYILYCDLVDL